MRHGGLCCEILEGKAQGEKERGCQSNHPTWACKKIKMKRIT